MKKPFTPKCLQILGIVLDLGGGPNHDRIGFRYWKNPGPFVQYNGISGTSGRFLGWWAVMTQAAFSYIGTEIVAVRYFFAFRLYSPSVITIMNLRLQPERRRTLERLFLVQFVRFTSVSSFSILTALLSSGFLFRRIVQT